MVGSLLGRASGRGHGHGHGQLAVAAATAMARLDERLQDHPLLPAFLFRARLLAVQEQAAVDGYHIDPWRLMAVLEGLPLRQPVDPADRADLHDATWCAYDLYAWLAFPEPARGRAIAAAQTVVREADAGQGTPLAAADGYYRWLWTLNRERAPMRAALVAHWQHAGLTRIALPVTGSAALRPEAPQERGAWVACFLSALRDEANALALLLSRLEYGWRTARHAARGRRSTSRAIAVVDLMAVHPLISATRVAGALDMSSNAALQILERLVRNGVAIEATHRSARRLFGLAGLHGIQDVVARPAGGAPLVATKDGEVAPAMPRFERSLAEPEDLDYTELDAAMKAADAAVRLFLARVGATTMT